MLDSIALNAFLVFLLGISIGSFLNCLIYRLEKKKSFFQGRSFCPQCKHILVWKDLIPLLSFFMLRGRCRYCQKPISRQYPLVELASGLLFVLGWKVLAGEPLFSLIYYWLIGCFLIIIFVYDFKHLLIPDQIVFPAIVLTIVFNLLRDLFWKDWSQLFFFRSVTLEGLIAALLTTLPFLALFWLSRGQWLGFGDVKLIFFLGNLLLFPNVLIALFLAFVIGAFWGLALIVLAKKSLKTQIALGPFLVLGAFLTIFWAKALWQAYFHWLGLL